MHHSLMSFSPAPLNKCVCSSLLLLLCACSPRRAASPRVLSRSSWHTPSLYYRLSVVSTAWLFDPSWRSRVSADHGPVVPSRGNCPRPPRLYGTLWHPLLHTMALWCRRCWNEDIGNGESINRPRVLWPAAIRPVEWKRAQGREHLRSHSTRVTRSTHYQYFLLLLLLLLFSFFGK